MGEGKAFEHGWAACVGSARRRRSRQSDQPAAPMQNCKRAIQRLAADGVDHDVVSGFVGRVAFVKRFGSHVDDPRSAPAPDEPTATAANGRGDMRAEDGGQLDSQGTDSPGRAVHQHRVALLHRGVVD